DLRRAVGGMAGNAAFLRGLKLAQGDRGQIGATEALDVLVVGLLRLDGDFAQHFRVRGPAVLGAKDRELALLRGTKPQIRITTGHRVLLHAERRDGEAVQHVARFDQYAHVTTYWNVQLRVRVFGPGIRKGPGPLLSRGLDLEHVFGRGVHVGEAL